MQGSCNQSLASSIFASDQYVRFGGTNARDEFDDRPHPRGFRDQVGCGAAQELVLRFELLTFAQRARQFDLRPNNAEEPIVVPRLRDKIARAAFHRFHRQIDRCPSRHYDKGQGVIDRLDPRDYIESLLTGSGIARVIEIHHQERIIAFFERIQHGPERSRGLCLIAFAFQQDAQRLEHIALVIGNQDFTHG